MHLQLLIYSFLSLSFLSRLFTDHIWFMKAFVEILLLSFPLCRHLVSFLLYSCLIESKTISLILLFVAFVCHTYSQKLRVCALGFLEMCIQVDLLSFSQESTLVALIYLWQDVKILPRKGIQKLYLDSSLSQNCLILIQLIPHWGQ